MDIGEKRTISPEDVQMYLQNEKRGINRQKWH